MIVVALVALYWLRQPETAEDGDANGVGELVEDEPAAEKDAPKVLRESIGEATDEAPATPELKLPGRLPKLDLPPEEPDYGRLDTAGQLPKSAGAVAISALYPHAMMCLVQARQRDSNVGSRITLRLLVVPGEDGSSRVADLDAIDKGKTSKPLRDCLREVAGELRFDAGAGVRGTVTAPMVLGKDPDAPPPGAMMPMQAAGSDQVIDAQAIEEPPEPGEDEHGLPLDEAPSGTDHPPSGAEAPAEPPPEPPSGTDETP